MPLIFPMFTIAVLTHTKIQNIIQSLTQPIYPIPIILLIIPPPPTFNQLLIHPAIAHTIPKIFQPTHISPILLPSI
ncbi:GntT/GntP/DsdX family permease, partial [Staphylococcus warneri]